MSNNLIFRKITPFIRRIPVSGGSFYAFSSASEDLTLRIDGTEKTKFRFSKYALLNIPNISSGEHFKNTLKLNAPAGAYKNSSFQSSTDNNYHLANSFQNYCLNLETMLLSDDNYDHNLAKTVSERVFFKWLKELSGIRFNQLNQGSLLRFSEEEQSENYNQVVKFISEIDASGNIRGRDANYTEVYINIPNDIGESERVLFKVSEDNNYYPGKILQRNSDGLDNEIIFGRKNTDIHPDKLDIRAHYDADFAFEEKTEVEFDNSDLKLWKLKSNAIGYNIERNLSTNWTDYEYNKWWFDYTPLANQYILPEEFTNPKNEHFAIYGGDSIDFDEVSTKFIRNKLDGIEIDFDINNYKPIISNINISNLNDLGRGDVSKDFEFNAIMLYYDLFEENIDENNEIVTNVLSTNLFGVLFLDNIQNISEGAGEIKRFKKYRANDLLNINGNEFAFKLNLKLDIANSVISEFEINPAPMTLIAESNTIAMNMFFDALSEIVYMGEIFKTYQADRLTLLQKMNEIENIYGSIGRINQIDVINSKLEEIQKFLNFNNDLSNFTYNGQNIFSIVTDLSVKLNDLISGKISPNVVVDLNKFKAGFGINLNKTNDQVEISSDSSAFSYQEDKPIWNFSQDFLFDGNSYVKTATVNGDFNYIRVTNHDNIKTTKNIIINLSAQDKIKKGQLFRISFDKKLTLNDSNYLIIKLNDTEIWKLSGININTYNKLLIELHCYDEQKQLFLADIF